MEYIRGGTLRQILETSEITKEDLRVWFAQLVLALEYLHHQRIMHRQESVRCKFDYHVALIYTARDVKPSNCMVDTFGHLKLTDFGLALKGEDNDGVEYIRVPEERSGDINEEHNMNPSVVRVCVSAVPSVCYVSRMLCNCSIFYFNTRQCSPTCSACASVKHPSR